MLWLDCAYVKGDPLVQQTGILWYSENIFYSVTETNRIGYLALISKATRFSGKMFAHVIVTTEAERTYSFIGQVVSVSFAAVPSFHHGILRADTVPVLLYRNLRILLFHYPCHKMRFYYESWQVSG
jgi:hypothetical protein